jgi:hypothetical protein
MMEERSILKHRVNGHHHGVIGVWQDKSGGGVVHLTSGSAHQFVDWSDFFANWTHLAPEDLAAVAKLVELERARKFWPMVNDKLWRKDEEAKGDVRISASSVCMVEKIGHVTCDGSREVVLNRKGDQIRGWFSCPASFWKEYEGDDPFEDGWPIIGDVLYALDACHGPKGQKVEVKDLLRDKRGVLVTVEPGSSLGYGDAEEFWRSWSREEPKHYYDVSSSFPQAMVGELPRGLIGSTNYVELPRGGHVPFGVPLENLRDDVDPIVVKYVYADTRGGFSISPEEGERIEFSGIEEFRSTLRPIELPVVGSVVMRHETGRLFSALSRTDRKIMLTPSYGNSQDVLTSWVGSVEEFWKGHVRETDLRFPHEGRWILRRSDGEVLRVLSSTHENPFGAKYDGEGRFIVLTQGDLKLPGLFFRTATDFWKCFSPGEGDCPLHILYGGQKDWTRRRKSDPSGDTVRTITDASPDKGSHWWTAEARRAYNLNKRYGKFAESAKTPKPLFQFRALFKSVPSETGGEGLHYRALDVRRTFTGSKGVVVLCRREDGLRVIVPMKVLLSWKMVEEGIAPDGFVAARAHFARFIASFHPKPHETEVEIVQSFGDEKEPKPSAYDAWRDKPFSPWQGAEQYVEPFIRAVGQ